METERATFILRIIQKKSVFLTNSVYLREVIESIFVRKLLLLIFDHVSGEECSSFNVHSYNKS